MKKLFFIFIAVLMVSFVSVNTVQAANPAVGVATIMTAIMLDNCASSVSTPLGLGYPLTSYQYHYQHSGRWTSENPGAGCNGWHVTGGAVQWGSTTGTGKYIRFLDEFTTYTVKYVIADVVWPYMQCASIWSAEKTVITYE